MTPWLILAAVITAGGLAAWSAQRGFRTCVCCKPRRRFRTVAERKWHEAIGGEW